MALGKDARSCRALKERDSHKVVVDLAVDMALAYRYYPAAVGAHQRAPETHRVLALWFGAERSR